MENKKIIFKSISVSNAADKMVKWRDDSVQYIQEDIERDFIKIREILVNKYKEIEDAQKYACDLTFGLFLYITLKEYGFTVRDGADDGVWRHLSLCVVPDIVGKRWGKTAETRYYKQSNRIWLKTIWWYIYLSWQGSIEHTREILKNNSTDQILQLVDRAGKKGYYVDTYRNIMRYFYIARENKKGIGDEEFRKVMTLHTALCTTINPDLYNNGARGYAKMLFKKLNIDVGD